MQVERHDLLRVDRLGRARVLLDDTELTRQQAQALADVLAAAAGQLA